MLCWIGWGKLRTLHDTGGELSSHPTYSSMCISSQARLSADGTQVRQDVGSWIRTHRVTESMWLIELGQFFEDVISDISMIIMYIPVKNNIIYNFTEGALEYLDLWSIYAVFTLVQTNLHNNLTLQILKDFLNHLRGLAIK